MTIHEVCHRRRNDTAFRAVVDEAAKLLARREGAWEDDFDMKTRSEYRFNPPGSVNQTRSFGYLDESKEHRVAWSLESKV